MNITIRHSILLSAACLSALFLGTSCDDVMNDGKEPETTSCSITGFAQKGQLAKGAQVTAFAIDSELVATGESFPANISDDRGAFSVSGKTVAPYLELRADGYYFNEITGDMSSAPLYLESFVESSDTKANINLMTTAIKLRVKKLFKEGKSFKDANAQAQNELLASFGIDLQTSDFGDMDITGSTESDAVLLACACAIQFERDAGGVSTLIQELASDLEDDGKIAEKNVSLVLENAARMDVNTVFKVIDNIAEYYSSKGIAGSVPPFYKYLDKSFDKDFVLFEEPYLSVERESWRGYAGTWRVLSSIDYMIETDCDWIKFEKKKVIGPYDRISYSSDDNETKSARTGTVTFKDAKGKVLEEFSMFQSPHMLKLNLVFGSATRGSLSMDIPMVGDEVLVNKTIFKVQEMYGNIAVFEVEPASQYRVSWPVENMGYDDNPAYVVKTFPYTVGPDVKAQYYGARKIQESVPSGNISVNMSICTAVAQFDTRNYPTASYAVIKGNSDDDCLSGTATYIWNRNDLYIDPSLVEFYSFKDKSREVKVTNLSAVSQNYVQVLPQELESGMSVTLYDSAGKVLVEKNSSRSITLDRGYILNLGTL